MREFPVFTPATNGEVHWHTVLLSPASVEDLLRIFDREGAARLWLELDEANTRAGGIPSVTSMSAA